jgi:hypothetical protein
MLLEWMGGKRESGMLGGFRGGSAIMEDSWEWDLNCFTVVASESYL